MLLFDELASPIAARRHGWLAGPRDVVGRADPAVLEWRIPRKPAGSQPVQSFGSTRPAGSLGRETRGL